MAAQQQQPARMPGDFPQFQFVDLDFATRLHDMPTFLAAEVEMLALCAITLWHASSRPKENGSRKVHVLLWFCAMFGGLANDVIFMALPLVDNFWHAQATVMISPRLPLYILALYNAFLYVPSAFLLWIFPTVPHGSLFGRIAIPLMTGLLALAFYEPFDLVGARFLWWTWHDTDTTIAARIHGVPLGSSTWLCVYSCCFSALFRSVSGPATVAAKSFFKSYLFPFLAVCVFSVPVMMCHMTILQSLVGGQWHTSNIGIPYFLPAAPPELPPISHRMFQTTLALYFAVVVYLTFKNPPAQTVRAVASTGQPDFKLATGWFFGLIVHFTFLITVAQFCDSGQVRSTGVHQTVGNCSEQAYDFSGQLRHVYVCPTTHQRTDEYEFIDNFPETTFGGDEATNVEWYSIKGVTQTSLWKVSATAISLFCMFVYLYLWFRRVQNMFQNSNTRKTQ